MAKKTKKKVAKKKVPKKADKISHYCDVMEEIKKRMAVIKGFLKGGCYTLYMPTTLECICLQLRKTLELIALGSLVLNKREYKKHHNDFRKHWNGGEILKKLEKINPDFYPKPIKEVPSSTPNIKSDLIDIKDGFLTKKEFLEAYGRCGKIAHADNPFGSKTNYDFYEKQILDWHNKIMKLMDTHTIRLANDKYIYLIHMQENDGKVHGYTFAPVDE